MKSTWIEGLPVDLIEACFRRGAGRELDSGKLDSLESSAALAANAFGFFLDRPSMLPSLPGLEELCWPASYVGLEEVVRFPWRGGRHPHLDILVRTDQALIGIESKRYEPFRLKGMGEFSPAYFKQAWGEGMKRFEALRDAIKEGVCSFKHLDAVQLIKHAFGLTTQVGRDADRPRKPVLVYLFAEPSTWASNRKPVDPEALAAHRREVAIFAALVSGDEVGFAAISYAQLMRSWSCSAEADVRKHAKAVSDRFSC